jgi:hypothetical protein
VLSLASAICTGCASTSPLSGRLEILGRAVVRLRIRCAVPRAQVTARLCDVAPDGSSTLVSRGVLNLESREGRDRAVPWPPGASGDVDVELTAAGYAFPPGHRIRVALSSAYWPWIWPHADGAGFEVDPANSALRLPVRDPVGVAEAPEIVFGEAEQAEPMAVKYADLSASRPARLVTRDVAAGLWTLDVDPGFGGSRSYPDGLDVTEISRERYWIRERDPLSARARSNWAMRFRRSEMDWDARVVTVSETRCTAAAFLVDNSVKCYDGEELIYEKNWRKEIPRGL